MSSRGRHAHHILGAEVRAPGVSFNPGRSLKANPPLAPPCAKMGIAALLPSSWCPVSLLPSNIDNHSHTIETGDWVQTVPHKPIIVSGKQLGAPLLLMGLDSLNK